MNKIIQICTPLFHQPEVLVMRFTLIFIILTSFLVFSNTSMAGGLKSERSGRTGYLKKDRFDSDRINIYDRNGEKKAI